MDVDAVTAVGGLTSIGTMVAACLMVLAIDPGTRTGSSFRRGPGFRQLSTVIKDVFGLCSAVYFLLVDLRPVGPKAGRQFSDLPNIHCCCKIMKADRNKQWRHGCRKRDIG